MKVQIARIAKRMHNKFRGLYWRQMFVTVGMVLLTLFLLGVSFFSLSYNYARGQQNGELAAQALEMDHVRLRGLMAIPPISPEPGANVPFFAAMKQLFVDIKGNMAHNQDDMDCLSMGMSGDFEDAIAQGATLVRVGTALFGPRPPMGQK